MCGEMLCKRMGEVLDLYMLQVCFRQASSLIQVSLNLSQFPSPEEGLVCLNCANLLLVVVLVKLPGSICCAFLFLFF